MDETINESDFLFYRGEDGKVHAQVILGDETVWVSQNNMAEIFASSKQNISYHLGNIFKEGELQESSVVKEVLTTATDGKRYNVLFYNLEAIIAVGYRISSSRATKFRQWATRILKEYLIKGFVLDDERLKQGNKLFGKDYFRELLERIREIRASEKLFYEKIKEYYATSVDYDKKSPYNNNFFAKAQNKLEYAVVGKTSAEIIRTRINSGMPNLGLKTYKNVNRDGEIRKTDITVAKNYLLPEELSSLNLLVTMFLDYTENYITRTNRVMKMADWEVRLDAFLTFNEYEILKGNGSISKAAAEKYAEKEFEKYKSIPRAAANNDYDKTFTTVNKDRQVPSEPSSEVEKEPLSDMNSKLVKALNYNPKDTAEKGEPKAKTKECPLCGKECDNRAKFCNGYVDAGDDLMPCPHIF